MPWRCWLPPKGKPVRAVLLTVHGLSGAAADFDLLGTTLSAKGYAIYGYELRGQGYDPGAKGDIPQARTWLRDLRTFHELVSRRHPRAAVVWYGESLGSLITLHTAARLELGCEPQAMILAAPLAGLRVELSELEKFLLRTSSHVLPMAKVTLGALAGVDEDKLRVTSGTSHGEQMRQTAHHVPAFTLRLIREIGNLMDETPRAARRIEMPVLVLASPHDIVSSPDQVQTLFRQLDSKDKKLLWYTRSYHLLLHDVQRDEVVKDVHGWLQRHTRLN
jgi:alpha-beta hydrolase superfamily lysophospholipase